MTQHACIEDPEQYSDDDYLVFSRTLSDPASDRETLEKVCMQLAHIPSQQAQTLLSIFRESERADEVEWLESAIEEGQFHYLSPRNECEEEEFLALKVVQELSDCLIELDLKRDQIDLSLRKQAIIQQAIKVLIEQGELNGDALQRSDEETQKLLVKLAEVIATITKEEKVINQIKSTITTERYKNLNALIMHSIHFD